jgi:hypothetical protein
MSVRQAAVVLFLVGLLALPGCSGGSSGLAVVKGKISYKEKPVPHGTVNFLPNDGNKPMATGEIQPDGSYELKTFVSNKPSNGAVIGQHKVVIVAIQDQATLLPEQRSPLSEPIVPVKYTSAATSDLSANVENKENTIDFDLKDGK